MITIIIALKLTMLGDVKNCNDFQGKDSKRVKQLTIGGGQVLDLSDSNTKRIKIDDEMGMVS